MARNLEFDWYLVAWMGSTHTSQADLIRATGYPKAKMSDLVNGNTRYNRDIVNELSKALNIRPYELLMHPDDANAIRRLRESALTIAAENTREAPIAEPSSEKPKKVS